MKMVLTARRAAGMIVLLSLAACSTKPQEPPPEQLAQAERLRPENTELAQKYERSCLTCHGVRGSGAPLTGFASDWEPRQKQGTQTLLDNARNGIRAMPARGACSDCNDAELGELIAFMSTPGKAQ